MVKDWFDKPRLTTNGGQHPPDHGADISRAVHKATSDMTREQLVEALERTTQANVMLLETNQRWERSCNTLLALARKQNKTLALASTIMMVMAAFFAISAAERMGWL